MRSGLGSPRFRSEPGTGVTGFPEGLPKHREPAARQSSARTAQGCLASSGWLALFLGKKIWYTARNQRKSPHRCRERSSLEGTQQDLLVRSSSLVIDFPVFPTPLPPTRSVALTLTMPLGRYGHTRSFPMPIPVIGLPTPHPPYTHISSFYPYPLDNWVKHMGMGISRSCEQTLSVGVTAVVLQVCCLPDESVLLCSVCLTTLFSTSHPSVKQNVGQCCD